MVLLNAAAALVAAEKTGDMADRGWTLAARGRGLAERALAKARGPDLRLTHEDERPPESRRGDRHRDLRTGTVLDRIIARQAGRKSRPCYRKETGLKDARGSGPDVRVLRKPGFPGRLAPARPTCPSSRKSRRPRPPRVPFRDQMWTWPPRASCIRGEAVLPPCPVLTDGAVFPTGVSTI